MTVPVLSFSGTRLWWMRRRVSGPELNNVPITAADTVILVGSENNTTWGFARELHGQMTVAGRRVITVEMNQLAENYPQASLLIILTSTYGDGGAPASADIFKEKLSHFHPTKGLSFGVLGFGDKQFSKFCQFAVEVDEALACRGINRLADCDFIDRQSTEQFSLWGKHIADLTGLPLNLNYSARPVARFELQLINRADFGLEVQAPTSILRFGPVAAKKSWLHLAKTEPSKSVCANSQVACVPDFCTISKRGTVFGVSFKPTQISGQQRVVYQLF